MQSLLLIKFIISKLIAENKDRFYPIKTIDMIDRPVRKMKAIQFNMKPASQHLVITPEYSPRKMKILKANLNILGTLYYV